MALSRFTEYTTDACLRVCTGTRAHRQVPSCLEEALPPSSGIPAQCLLARIAAMF